MAGPSPLPRLIDIIEAIELIRGEMAGVMLKAFEPDRRQHWLVERGLKLSPKRAAACPHGYTHALCLIRRGACLAAFRPELWYS
jgi:hypothetical protein